MPRLIGRVLPAVNRLSAGGAENRIRENNGLAVFIRNGTLGHKNVQTYHKAHTGVFYPNERTNHRINQFFNNV